MPINQMLAQKDIDARWTKKNEQNYYGYKNHINADQKHKLIQNYRIIPFPTYNP